jgi:Fe-S-cluster containining protein
LRGTEGTHHVEAEGADEIAKPSAGDFSSWLRRTRTALMNDGAAEVPCGGCNACCRSAYFIHIKPEEIRTLSRIPRALLFPAPGLPPGNAVMGFDEKGHCPMLVEEECSIYEDRPLTCRSYDCRVFPAAGLEEIGAGKAPVRERSRSWEFSHPTELDDREHAAARAAAAFMRDRAECFPGGFLPSNPTQLAVLAIKVCALFLEHPTDSGERTLAASDPDIARAIVEAIEGSEA